MSRAGLSRRDFGKRVGAGLAAGLWSRAAARAAPDRRRRLNVLFLASDDMRGAGLHCLGDPVARTPHLDALAARGTLFERAYCQQAICNPSRASLMTGLRPDTLRVWDLPTHFRDTHPDVVTLPQQFLRHGYFTQDVGKIYHNGDTRIRGDPASWSVPARLFWGDHTRDDHAQVAPGTPRSLPALVATDDIRDEPDEAHLDGRVAATAIQALREIARRDEPFFFAVGFWKPHRPFNAPKRYWDLYRPADIPPPRPPGPPEDAPAPALVSQYVDDVARVKEVPAAVNELRRGYYAATSYMDAQLGKVLAELDRLGLADHTLVVYWADHGYQQGEHGMWGKTSCFELDARVPLMIVPPRRLGLPTGTRVAEIVELLDLYPTLLELAGLPPAPGGEGQSLVPLLRRPGSPVRGCAFTQNPRPWRPAHVDGVVRAELMGYSVRTAAWRYTEWRDWSTGAVTARELYDERADPDESRNLARDPGYASALGGCAALLRRRLGDAAPARIAAPSENPLPSRSL